MRQRLTTRLLLTLALAFTFGCTRMIVWATKETATWAFIQERCGGIKIGRGDTSDTYLSIPIDVHDNFDSGICMYDAKGRLSGTRIELSVKKGLCSGGPFIPLVARIPKPLPGDYLIVYADRGANYPKIGTVHVE
jgi:hypothetical protein